MTVSKVGSSKEVLPQPPQTPLFRATQAARYRRQDNIRAIQEATGRKLICYVSGPAGYINRDDVLPLTDLLQSAKPGIKLDLMLHTLGGTSTPLKRSQAFCSRLWDQTANCVS
jgi:hypothetical protein